MRHSIEYLREHFSYDPGSGVLTRLKGRVDFCGPLSLGTHNTRFENKTYLTTHLIWALHYGYWPSCIVDHKDGNKMNTKIVNLREATHQQNQFNKVGYGKYPKGVVFKRDAKRSKPWSARIRIKGKKVALGSFATMEEAEAAYLIAAEKIQGEFALHKSLESR